MTHNADNRPVGRNGSPTKRRPGRAGEAIRHVGRWALGAALLGAGVGHLTTMRQEFQAQVPTWVPLDPDFVVLASGVVEIGLGAALILAPSKFRPAVGWITAGFFVAIFPGNISQYVTGTDAFGLDTDRARLVRLFFQPLLVAWALWSTGAWRAWRSRVS
ncbi:DoxX family protein [Dietzia psychralcaliphila]|uniref:DoxX family protein n=1 Tax=Dietzia psychralcaliphila TaxID=139021 RepID=UPI0020A6235E|nr:DoxX family membrane protein [Dietzia psychralcaliphila]